MNQPTNISLNYKLDRESMIRFQVVVYCHMNDLFRGVGKIQVADVDCMTLVGLYGKADLLSLCKELVEYKIYKTIGSARNAISEMEEKKLLVKEKRKGRRKVAYLHPDMRIGLQEQTVLDIKCYS